MSDSIELKTIKKCASQLETALVGLDSKLVHFLQEEGYITDDVHDRILNPASLLGRSDKASELVKWIRNRIQLHSESYHMLINWFRKNGKLYQPIVNILELEFNSHAYQGSELMNFDTSIPVSAMCMVAMHNPEQAFCSL